MRRRWFVTVVVVSFGLAACSDGGGRAGRSVPPTSTTNLDPAGTTTAGAVTIAPAPGLASARVKLTRIATIEQPLAMATRTGDDVLYVAEKTGRVRALRATKSPGGLSGTEADLAVTGTCVRNQLNFGGIRTQVRDRLTGSGPPEWR